MIRLRLFALLLMVIAGLILISGPVSACEVQGEGEVNIVSNAFPAYDLFERIFEQCQHEGLVITHKQTTEHQVETKHAFAGATSPFEAAFVANSSIVDLQSEGLLRPLDDLVAKYRDKYELTDSMLVRLDGKIYAVAYQANAQHLFYRKDILEKHGIAVPTTYEQALAACEKLKNVDSLDYPFAAAYKTGWNLAQEFMNIYLGTGADVFKPGTAEPAFNSEKGLQALNLMKRLYGNMSPNALVNDSAIVQQQFMQGRVGLAFLWGNRAKKVMTDETESRVIGKVGIAKAPSVPGAKAPATTVWWDGFVMPKNMDGDADLAFRVLMEAYKKEVVAENNDLTIWLRDNYTPTEYATGIIDSVKAGAPPYPMSPQQRVAHVVFGEQLGNFFSGKKTAQEVLSDCEEGYLKLAKERGII